MNCNCPNQGNIISLLESLQNSVASLKTQLQDVSKSVQDMKESIPDTIQNRLNVSWTGKIIIILARHQGCQFSDEQCRI